MTGFRCCASYWTFSLSASSVRAPSRRRTPRSTPTRPTTGRRPLRAASQPPTDQSPHPAGIEDGHTMADLKRYVVGLNENAKSAVLMDGIPNQQELKDLYWRATLWKTRETPVDNSVPGDRSLDGGPARSPFPGGMLVRALELWPDHDPETAQKNFVEVNTMVGHTQQIS